jgi:twitching motility two-component system response regulator PilH
VTHVLVVEDDPWIAWMVADELTDRGCQVSMAGDGTEALHQLEESRPDVIVLDLMLPTMHGWDFVERYQQHTGGTRLPIIVVSAAGAVPRSLEKRGVRHYLRKPFDLEELANCVANEGGAPEVATSSVTI